jgi:hypothetical protein
MSAESALIAEESALELGAKSFWTFDERQAKLAIAEGFTTS